MKEPKVSIFPAVSAQELNKLHCQEPGCDHSGDEMLVLAPRCHPHSPVVAVYHKSLNMLGMECAQCRQVVVFIRVADKIE